MCGIAGLFNRGGDRAEALMGNLSKMVAAMRHRGPDDASAWTDGRAGIGLGHARLAVVELSELGRQPMKSRCGRWVTVFNGEIYNFKALRNELLSHGHAFRGHSDTEVLLASVSQWGLDEALSRFAGMFAFALWDRSKETLSLVRDRIGEKPLYYGTVGHTFVFASDLSAFTAYSAANCEIDRDALAAYVRFGYVPAPQSIYAGVRKLPPGCFLTVADPRAIPEPARYWSATKVALAGLAAPLTCDAEEAVAGLDSLLSDATSLETSADVPVGAFLSGGIDSTAVVAMMCRHSSRVRTFTVGFADKRYDESRYARRVASHLGTQHTEIELTPADAMAAIPRLPGVYTEPFADASQIPTLLVSELARRSVTVSLSGDGGDELFGGYNRYAWAENICRSIRHVPPQMRAVVGSCLAALSPAALDAVWTLVPARAGIRHAGDKLHKLAGLLSASDASDVYLRLVSHWYRPEQVVRGTTGETGPLPGLSGDAGSLKHRMMLCDTLTYLPDDILVKLDRASMANSLEARAPFLDHRIFEFAWRLPLHFKIRNGRGKWLIRKVLDRYVPNELMDRPKAGFAIPLDSWIRGPLRDWAEDLLNEQRLRSEDFLQPEPVLRRWREHLTGARNWVAPLWAILMFQAWYASQRSGAVRDSVHLQSGIEHCEVLP